MSDKNRYSDDNKVHDKERLKELQSLPLDRKIQITQTRLIEWYTYWQGKCYVSFSGGKDSTVLSDLAARVCKTLGYKLILWFSDTGLEYPEIKLNFYFFGYCYLSLFYISIKGHQLGRI
jgi:3'-phosphoadenosine 5'-phosphosulfate sulfotransferase (PAPS reductase)/FAD synthetase